ncbi:MAG: ATP-binding protein [Lysobacteraceae bacterium]
MTWLREFAGSMGGRIFAILLLGVALAAVLATALANWRREREVQRLHVALTAERVADYVALVELSEGDLRGNVLEMGAQGINVRRSKRGEHEGVIAETHIPETASTPDPEFDSVVAASGLKLSAASVQMAPEDCLSGRSRHRYDELRRQRAYAYASLSRIDPALAARQTEGSALDPPLCRWIDVTLSDGNVLKLSVYTPPTLRMPREFDPWVLALLGGAIAVLAYLIARMAAAPLLRLARAATELGRDLDRAPIPETGPAEVVRAASAFNAMQARLQGTLRERTHMLAAITHDLQTPLTRLRLRLEKVEDEPLRERLVGDLAAMQALIREGLDLARSADSIEARVPLDLDSLLESLVEDAADAGADIAFERQCNSVLKLRPLAMRRVFANLIDNALKYGGAAKVNARREHEDVIVVVSNPGAPLPEDRIAAMFEPFVRLEESRSRDTGGIGLGLTIARTLAEREGATLELRNVADGVEAVVRWKRAPLA